MRKLFLFFYLIALDLHAELFFSADMIKSHLQSYTPHEIELIEKDLAVVRSVVHQDVDSGSKFYLATAGAPGSRKTTILERFLSQHPDYRGIYLDPDPRALKFMAHTYYAQSLNSYEISKASSYDEVIEAAYNKWRGGSNYITLALMEEGFAEGKSIIHGSTSTGGHLPIFLQKLKQAGYEIIFLLCSCEDQTRYDAVEYRNKEIRFYQSSPEDALSKGKLFPQRMQEYFRYADKLYFYWSDGIFDAARLGGTWERGTLKVCDEKAMDSFIAKYDADRAALALEGKKLPSFDELL